MEWFVLKTLPRQEKKIKEYLDKKNIENFLPLRRELHKYVNGRKKIIVVPILPAAIFVHIDPEIRFDLLRGMKYKVQWMIDLFTGSSMIIPEKQMQNFILLMQYHGEEVEIIQTPIQKGTKVLVTGGNFAGIVGEVIKINGERKVVLSLNNSFFISVSIDVKYLKML